ncbi:unnamed protein product [Prorocentrum cordatum]|uniref:Uncharacterized protein n=1 Tax=Prorocentrum cordatum TaxID=2364126 RepID=A0ABN9WHU4_9DINO|nr:unnamed protein product [Polarella glacialis]
MPSPVGSPVLTSEGLPGEPEKAEPPNGLVLPPGVQPHIHIEPPDTPGGPADSVDSMQHGDLAQPEGMGSTLLPGDKVQSECTSLPGDSTWHTSTLLPGDLAQPESVPLGCSLSAAAPGASRHRPAPTSAASRSSIAGSAVAGPQRFQRPRSASRPRDPRRSAFAQSLRLARDDAAAGGPPQKPTNADPALGPVPIGKILLRKDGRELNPIVAAALRGKASRECRFCGQVGQDGCVGRFCGWRVAAGFLQELGPKAAVNLTVPGPGSYATKRTQTGDALLLGSEGVARDQDALLKTSDLQGSPALQRRRTGKAAAWRGGSGTGSTAELGALVDPPESHPPSGAFSFSRVEWQATVTTQTIKSPVVEEEESPSDSGFAFLVRTGFCRRISGLWGLHRSIWLGEWRRKTGSRAPVVIARGVAVFPAHRQI